MVLPYGTNKIEACLLALNESAQKSGVKNIYSWTAEVESIDKKEKQF